MAFCIFLIFLCIVCSLVLIIISVKVNDDYIGLAIFSVMVSFFIIFPCSMQMIKSKIQVNREINNFVRQSEYIESISDNTIENAALNNTKIELNEWLYNAQYNYENYWLFTFYPSEIMELEEIR